MSIFNAGSTEKIIQQKLFSWRGILIGMTFPQLYDALKAYITTQTDQSKVIYGVISAHHKKKPELSMQTGETE
jgi:hypothetical protein